jgi:surface carbohydrate biosynthesis protein (TIGR04326 family)
MRVDFDSIDHLVSVVAPWQVGLRRVKYYSSVMSKLLLWCSPEHASPRGSFTVYWAQYISEEERDKGNISLPEMINDNASCWKPRYLSWLETVGKSPYGRTTVVDALLIRPGLSYWWMTIPSDYSFSTKSSAYAIIRLWALVQIADDHNVEELEAHGADAKLEEVLTHWCNRTGRQITFIRGHTTNKNESQVQIAFSHVKRRLSSLISGIGYIALQYLRYFTWRRHKISSETVDDPALNVVDYFANLDAAAARKGTYTSNYWGPITQILPLLGKTVNWIHIDVRSAAFPDVHSAREAIRGLNRGNSSSTHILLQDYLTLRIAFKAVAQFVRIRRFTKQVATQIPWTETVSGLDVSPIVLSHLQSELQGSGAATNALWLSLFEEAFPSRPAHDPCIYLMENQPWELALLQARIARGAGPNVGVAHVPVRTWDLRYAIGSSGVSAENGGTLPKPSRVAVIDPGSETVMIANGMAPSAIVKVEAMRFFSLIPTAATTLSNRTHAFTDQKVLIFGEYDALICAKQLQFLKELVPLIGDKYAFTFRPHPAKPFLRENLPAGVSLSEAHTARAALAECDAVLCSNVSSASLDAILMGIPIAMLRDGRLFDGSLLDAGPTVQYIESAIGVLSVLENSEFVVGSTSVDGLYPMYLDNGLTKWRALLNSL